MMPKISVIICTYNRCNNLKNILEYLNNQEINECFDYEVIVVDNNSSDDTKKTAENFKKNNNQIRYVFESKRGVSRARNKGIKAANGEVIVFTDDDCIVDKDWLKCIWDEVVSDDKFDLIIGDYRFIGSDYKKNKEFNDPLCGHGLHMIFKKKTFEKYGMFDELLGTGTFLATAEDVDISYRIIKAKGIVKLNKNLIVYHIPRIFNKEYFKEICKQGRGAVMFWYKYLILEKDIFAAYKIYSLFKKKFINALINYKEKDFINAKIHLISIKGYLSGLIIGPLYWAYKKLRSTNDIKMKIAFISTEVLPVPPIKGGAVETKIYELITRLPNFYNIFCFSIFDKQLPLIEKKGNITYCRFKPGLITKILTLTYKLPFKKNSSYLYWLPYSLWCAWKLMTLKPDVINIYNRIQFVPIIKFLNPRSKIILHIHQLSAFNYKRVWNNKILKKIDSIKCVSDFLRNSIFHRFPNLTDISCVYDGFDTSKFHPFWSREKERLDLRRSFNILENEKIILYAGRLAENKGVHLLIEAFNAIAKKRDNIKLMIFGEGVKDDPHSINYVSHIKRLADRTAPGKITFLGRISSFEIDKYYLLADILVVPSIVKEGLPNVIIEAMLTGIPVLTSGRGGLSEVVEHEKTGLIVSNIENREDLIENIERLLNDEGLRNTLGRNGYEYVRTKFNWKKIIENTNKMLDSVLNKKRILLCETSSGFGGSAVALTNITSYLDCKKFDLLLVVKNYGPQIEKIKNREVLKLKNYEEPNSISNFKFFIYFIKNLIPETTRLYLIIKKKNISLAHINNNIISGIPAIIAAKLSGIPCVCHIRQTRRLIKRERIFAKFVDKFILINREALELYRKDIEENRLNVIYDGIDLNQFSKIEKTSFREELSLNGFSLVGLVGRIVRGKGQKEFILSAKEVLKRRQNVKFMIVGDAKGDGDDYYKEVKALVESENLNEDIIFTGWRNDIKNIMSDLDILVQGTTTYPEGFGLTIVEAMTLGKPVIATNISGPSEIVIHGKNGLLIPPQNSQVMAEAIIKILDNPDLARKMGQAGRKRVEELFNIKKNIKELESLYRSLILKND